MRSKPLPTQKEFAAYLASMAVKEDTAVFVQQIPRRRDGKDLKDSWVAHTYNPRTKMYPEDAWYGNTASYIRSRVVCEVSATEQNCERVLFLVLDDIGTKVTKTPTLQPTWKIETSQGCFQWGYTFRQDSQPTKGRFAAAIHAIAEAGFTDMGACNAVRNFRIPGSVNLKNGRNSFVSILHEFDSSREFTLDEICNSINVVPGPDINGGYRKTSTDRVNDEVLNWLNDTGRVLSPVGSDGWAHILCPDWEEHTGQDTTGTKYDPKNRGFKCHHGHCDGKDSKWFLDWVVSQGGPKAAHGADHVTIQSALVPAIENLGNHIKKEGESVSRSESKKKAMEKAETSAGLVVHDISAKQASRDLKGDLFEQYAYMSDKSDDFFDMYNKKTCTRKELNALYRHVDFRSMHGGRRVEASVFFDENRDAKGSEVLSGISYAPGDKVIVSVNGLLYGNTWEDSRRDVSAGDHNDIDVWIDHGKSLFEDLADLYHVADVMAFKLQNPKIKINHAVLHTGFEGCGKDTFWAPFIWALGGGSDVSDPRNVSTIDTEVLNNQWGYHLEKELMIINELKESTTSERHKLANKMKPIIAAPPYQLLINKKGERPYQAVNRIFVLAFSNHFAAISIPDQDRRWFVVHSSAPRMSERKAKSIWDWYEKGGIENVAKWLYKRDVSAFNPAATPRCTMYKKALIEDSRSSIQSHIIQLVIEEYGEFSRGVVAGPFNRMADRLQGSSPSGVKIHHLSIMEALREAGWTNLGLVGSRKNATKKQVWVNRVRMADLNCGIATKAQLRDEAEEVVPSTIHLISKNTG
jgi:hypothetical protein